MKLKRTKEHMVLKLTHKEFEALHAALDSVNDATESGAYMDVVKLHENLNRIISRLQLYECNEWVGPK